MNPTAGAGAEGVLPNGLSTVQGQVSGFNGRFARVVTRGAPCWAPLVTTLKLALHQVISHVSVLAN